MKFANEIGLKYGHVANFRKISNKFGVYLQNNFRIEWVKFSHVEFVGNVISRNYRKHYAILDAEFYQNMQELIATAESKLLY